MALVSLGLAAVPAQAQHRFRTIAAETDDLTSASIRDRDPLGSAPATRSSSACTLANTRHRRRATSSWRRRWCSRSRPRTARPRARRRRSGRPASTIPAAFAFVQIHENTWTVAVNPGVADAVSHDLADAILLRRAGPARGEDLHGSLGTTVTQPALTIDKQGSIEAGLAPQNVTYTFDRHQHELDAGTDVEGRASATTCAGPRRTSAATTGDGKLSNGETWTFTCASCTRRRARTRTPRTRARRATSTCARCARRRTRGRSC